MWFKFEIIFKISQKIENLLLVSPLSHDLKILLPVFLVTQIKKKGLGDSWRRGWFLSWLVILILSLEPLSTAVSYATFPNPASISAPNTRSPTSFLSPLAFWWVPILTFSVSFRVAQPSSKKLSFKSQT